MRKRERDGGDGVLIIGERGLRVGVVVESSICEDDVKKSLSGDSLVVATMGESCFEEGAGGGGGESGLEDGRGCDGELCREGTLATGVGVDAATFFCLFASSLASSCARFLFNSSRAATVVYTNRESLRQQ